MNEAINLAVHLTEKPPSIHSLIVRTTKVWRECLGRRRRNLDYLSGTNPRLVTCVVPIPLRFMGSVIFDGISTVSKKPGLGRCQRSASACSDSPCLSITVGGAPVLVPDPHAG